MAVTREEYLAKKQIMDKLAKEGYPTYAQLLDLFDLNLTNDPNVVGFMVPNKGVIVLNRNLDIDQVSTIVRHEILHEYLSHALRMERHLGKEAYDKRSPSIHDLINIAADYEISNRGYTEKDKNIIRAIKLNGKVLHGLVTEDDHPDWVDWSVEEMYDELKKQYDKDMEALKPLMELIQQLNQQMDKDIEKAEQIEREANDISNELGNGGGSSSEKSDDEKQKGNSGSGDGESEPGKGDEEKSDAQKAADEIAKQAKDLADQMKDKQGGTAHNQNKGEKGKPGGQHQKDGGEVFDTPNENAEKVKIAKKLKTIEQAFDQYKDALAAEDYKKISKEKAIKAEKELKKYRANPITNFKISLQDLVKRQVGINRDLSWSRPNRRYQGTGILAQGRAIRNKPIPVINVYFDVSGSVQPYVESSRAALSVLKNFVDRGLIKVNLYYVSTRLSSNENDSTGGGADGDLIMDHIRATKPTNVVIVTDGDADGKYPRTVIPGGVYFLFPNKNYIPKGLIAALSGEKATRTFYIAQNDEY